MKPVKILLVAFQNENRNCTTGDNKTETGYLPLAIRRYVYNDTKTALSKQSKYKNAILITKKSEWYKYFKEYFKKTVNEFYAEIDRLEFEDGKIDADVAIDRMIYERN